MADRIVGGQKVTDVKADRARELRRQMTAEEKLLWTYLRAHRNSGLHFRRQQVIAGFIVDFYCHKASLVVEVDGPIHERNPEYDHERDEILISRGLRILRLTNEQVQQDLCAVLAEIDAACVTSDQLRKPPHA